MTQPEDSRQRRRLVFATRNEGKLAELVDLLRDTQWHVARLPDDVGEYEETGANFAENARGKALYAAARIDAPVLADDSGIVIDALGGAPGVLSARYIDPAMSPDERNRAVLNRMLDVPPAERTARFECHLVLAFRDEVVHETTGVCEGRITTAPRGDGGFGYDPIFEIPELGATFAEISRLEKSTRSHRGRAVRTMADFLRTWQPT